MAKIDFISAEDGGIKFYGGRDDVAMKLSCIGFAKTPEMVNYIIKDRGLANQVMHSSSMDFADEYGFGNLTLSYFISIELVNLGLILWLSSISREVFFPL